MTVTAISDPTIVPPEVAFAVGRRHANAVQRNRAKRRLRAVLAATPPPAGLYLVRADGDAARVPFAQLTADVDHAVGIALGRDSR